MKSGTKILLNIPRGILQQDTAKKNKNQAGHEGENFKLQAKRYLRKTTQNRQA